MAIVNRQVVAGLEANRPKASRHNRPCTGNNRRFDIYYDVTICRTLIRLRGGSGALEMNGGKVKSEGG